MVPCDNQESTEGKQQWFVTSNRHKKLLLKCQRTREGHENIYCDSLFVLPIIKLVTNFSHCEWTVPNHAKSLVKYLVFSSKSLHKSCVVLRQTKAQNMCQQGVLCALTPKTAKREKESCLQMGNNYWNQKTKTAYHFHDSERWKSLIYWNTAEPTRDRRLHFRWSVLSHFLQYLNVLIVDTELNQIIHWMLKELSLEEKFLEQSEFSFRKFKYI